MRHTHKIVTMLLCLVAVMALWLQYQRLHPVFLMAEKADVATQISHLATDAPLRLVTEPADGTSLVRNLIQHAQQSVDLVIYQLTDTEVESDLAATADRGVRVRVIMNKQGPFKTHPNDDAYAFLQSRHVSVEWSPEYFPFFHQKTLVIDGVQALIMTFNLTPKYYATSRDFAVLDQDTVDVQAIEQTFEADWQGTPGGGGTAHGLVWSPGSSESMLGIINNATASLDIYNEEMADPQITDALKSAASRGVDVKVVMTYATSWKPAFVDLVAAGVKVRTFASTGKLYIHAKVIIADAKTAFVGSENFSNNSLDNNRELGILMLNPEIVSSLTDTFEQDFAAARVYKTSATI